MKTFYEIVKYVFLSNSIFISALYKVRNLTISMFLFAGRQNNGNVLENKPQTNKEEQV